MAKLSTIIAGMIKRPPILLPLVGLAHVVWLLRTIWDCRDLEGLDAGWLQLLWMLGYTFFWLVACNLKRWGIYGYLGLTIMNTVIYVTATSSTNRAIYTSNLFLIDMQFCFFLVLYFKRFD